jgi:hypothetical protein
MVRKIKEDTKRIKDDLERILKNAESFLKAPPTFFQKLKSGFGLASKIYLLCEDYNQVSYEVKKDKSVKNKKGYLADVIRESTNYLAENIIERYVK